MGKYQPRHIARNKVLQHQDYKQDSKSIRKITFDLIDDSIKITELKDRQLIEGFLVLTLLSI